MNIKTENKTKNSGWRLDLFLKAVFYALVLTAVVHLIILQAIPVHGDTLYAEGSLTEWLQIYVLAITMLLFTWAGVKDAASRSFNAAVVGFLSVVFVREMDRAFDKLFDGAWQVAVVFIAVITVLMVIRTTGSFWAKVKEFASRPAYGMFLSGMLIVMVFSRLYGQKFLWKAVMGDKYMYSVKAAAEENTELLGYCLIMFSGMEWLARCRRTGEKSNA